MPIRHLLDTNILSDLLKNPTGRVALKISSLPSDEREALSTSIIVAAELRYGAVKSGSSILAKRVDQLLEVIEVLPFESKADQQYAMIRSKLEKVGMIIGGNDLLIAAQALALDAVFVTDNVREFKRVTGLRIENWLRA
jgi:tRNA(fMet)-specific endonuclease VapC